MTTPDKGFELGLEQDAWSVQFAHSRGPGNVGPTTGHQDTLQVVYVQPDWRVGLGHARTQSSAGDRSASVRCSAACRPGRWPGWPSWTGSATAPSPKAVADSWPGWPR